ncbi:DUF4365 domain-containing protein [Pseudoalteromonas gelatinilytica]|uniref:DUF4365 domain-containing protein n=1 Tax=Pseudoalteromonas gelatinilytica TaxID=1703256 RepID=UPI0007C5D22D|nr:DUF4365 domain-containing protein [Pseudoalteromonas gelatinilytica]
MSDLPRESTSQEIGRLAADVFGVKKPRAWIPTDQSGDTDFGVDYVIQLKSHAGFVGASFYVQLKGTTVPSYSKDNKYISYDFKVKTLNYYNRQEPAVMVAVVDLKDSNDEIWNCPVYYFWLDDDWFFDNKAKLEEQETISVKIPTSNLLIPNLDIYDYYDERLNEKLKVAELKREIKPLSQNVAKSIESITNAISEKPLILKAAENQGDEPWLVNPNGETPTKLKLCSDYLNCNQLDSANNLLADLEGEFSELTSHEKAEFLYQKAAFLSLQTKFQEANRYFEDALQYSDKDRYKLGFLESKFKLSEVPDPIELQEIADSLDDDEFGNAMTKCKCLALIGKADEALGILKAKYPNRIVGQLVILTLTKNDEELDQLLDSNSEDLLDNDRNRYSYHAFAARRAYVKATSESSVYGEVLPIQGKVTFDVQLLKKALFHAEKAWDFAKKTGYPSDISILLDISSLIFGYFNKADELFYYFEEILKQRPHNVDLAKHYATLAFNKGLHEKTISLLNSQNIEYNGNDYGLLILSYYHLGKSRVALDYLRKGESRILEDRPQNTALLFCVGAELAEKQMEEELACKYIDLVKEFENGEAVLAINSFIQNSNQNPDSRGQYCDQLYKEYQRLNKPVEIAEQLFRYLNPTVIGHAHRICELSECILNTHELFEKDYLRLAQAYITSGQHELALSVAEKHIDREVYDPYWTIIQTVCYHNLGRLGLAHGVIKRAIEENPFSLEHRHYYANICLQMGLMDEVESALFDILEASAEREHKISVLVNLISILSSKSNSSVKTATAIRQFGKLVNQNDMEEEGRFLIFFLTSANTKDKDEIADFQARLANYSKNFPNSSILKQGYVDVGGDADSLVASLHKMAGITDEQLAKWEQNKLKIRNGSLPVPFVLLDRFLSDTHDIFTSWMNSLNSAEEHLEFKIKHAPQLDGQTFNLEFTTERTVIIEDTTLLILHELQLLEPFLEIVSEFCVLNSTFERFAKNSHPVAGTIYAGLAKDILDTMNKFKSKMVLFYDEESSPVNSYLEAIKRHDALFIVDDLNLLQLVNVSNKEQITSANIFNVIEMLHNKTHLSQEDKFTLISKSSSLGFQIPNMTLSLLAETLAFHSKTLNEIDYLDTEFNVIFDKVFTTNRDTVEAVELFLKMLGFSINQFDMALQPAPTLELLRSFLFRHCYKDLESFVAFVFVYLALATPVKIESQLISTSQKHVELWQLYQGMQVNNSDDNISIEELVVRVVVQLFMLQDKPRQLAYNNIKHCFVPLTSEYEAFEKAYLEASLQHRLFNS